MSFLHGNRFRTGLAGLPLVLLLAGCGLADPDTRYPVSPRLAKQAQNIYATPGETRGSIVDAVPAARKTLGTETARSPGTPRLSWRLYGDGEPPAAEATPAAVTPGTGTGLFAPRTGEVDPQLWRAALDAVALMPLALSDPEKGVILTDWYQVPELPDQRVKIAIYVLGGGRDARSLRVAIQRQERDAQGRWQDRPAAPGSILELERRILERAATLAEASGG